MGIYRCFVSLTDWKVAKFLCVKEQSAYVNAFLIYASPPIRLLLRFKRWLSDVETVQRYK